MRTKNPTSIRADYVAALADVRRTFANANASAVATAEKSLIAEYAFLSAATLWEGFLGDLFVAYVNRDSTVFRAALVSQMAIETSSEFAKRAKSHAVVTLPKHLSTGEIRAILDARDWNVTFTSIPDLKAKAGQWLALQFAGHFTSLSHAHSSALEAVRAVRNFLAHRSGSSRTLMQQSLIEVNLPAGLRRGTNSIRDVGSFLRSQPALGAPTRIFQYLDTLEQCAIHLCP